MEKNTYEKITRTIRTFFLFLGILSSFFIFHEVYHLHNGIPMGVCIGNCRVDGVSGLVPMVLFFSEPIEIDVLNEENNAWMFSFIVNCVLISVYFMFIDSKKYEK